MLRKAKKPGARGHVHRTPAQWRALRVFQLRGLYWNLGVLDTERRAAARLLIDAQLAELGAETETTRHQRRIRQWEAEGAADDDAFEEVPF